MLFHYPIENIISFTSTTQIIVFLCTFAYLGISIAGSIVFLIFTFHYVQDNEYFKKTILTSIYYATSTILGLCAVFFSFLIPNANDSIMNYFHFKTTDYPFQQLTVFLFFILYLFKTFSTLNKKFAYGNIIWIVYMFLIKDWSCLYVLVPIVAYHLGGHFYFYKNHEITSFKWMIGTEIVTLIVYLVLDIKSYVSFGILFFISLLCEIVNFGTTAGITYGLYEITNAIVSNQKENTMNMKKRMERTKRVEDSMKNTMNELLQNQKDNENKVNIQLNNENENNSDNNLKQRNVKNMKNKNENNQKKQKNQNKINKKND